MLKWIGKRRIAALLTFLVTIGTIIGFSPQSASAAYGQYCSHVETDTWYQYVYVYSDFNLRGRCREFYVNYLPGYGHNWGSSVDLRDEEFDDVISSVWNPSSKEICMEDVYKGWLNYRVWRGAYITQLASWFNDKASYLYVCAPQ